MHIPLGSRWKVKTLTYRISKYPRGLSRQETDSEVTRAFNVWSQVTPLQFYKKSSGQVSTSVRKKKCSILSPYPAYTAPMVLLGSHRYPIRTRRTRRRRSFRRTWRHPSSRFLPHLRRRCAFRRQRKMDHSHVQRHEFVPSGSARIRPLARFIAFECKVRTNGSFLPRIRSVFLA